MAGEAPSQTGDEPLSRAHLSRLRAEVGDATLRRYAQAYLDLLPERLNRIGQAIEADDTAEAERVIVDLQISSRMLGTRRLATTLTALQSSLHTGLIPSTVQLARVRTEAALVAATVRAAMDLDGLDGLDGLDDLERPDHSAPAD
ncbi:HPt (histidine-containing phosphotransfer) domain-containing protein [Catenulispora sp. GAS73]|uniref:hypothetical protein n=1 Tax=Catenulispora sp. GAS73 TaxID=3156269 RepID=UPI0035147654